MTISMKIDQDLYIRSLSDNWYQEALGAKHNLVGSHLLDFIGGDLIQKYTLSQIEKANRTRRAVFTTYRCDDNRVKREFVLKVQSHRDGTVTLAHELVWSERLRASDDDTTITLISNSINKCSICCSYNWAGEWLDTAALLAANPEMNANYYRASICPVCLAKVNRELKLEESYDSLSYQAVG